VIVAGGRVRNGRFARITAVGEVTRLADASTLGIPPTKAVRPFVDAWETVSERLLTSLTRREQERAESLASKLAALAEEDAAALRDVLEELHRSIQAEIDDGSRGVKGAQTHLLHIRQATCRRRSLWVNLMSSVPNRRELLAGSRRRG
jgi:hypothetical protein